MGFEWDQDVNWTNHRVLFRIPVSPTQRPLSLHINFLQFDILKCAPSQVNAFPSRENTLENERPLQEFPLQ